MQYRNFFVYIFLKFKTQNNVALFHYRHNNNNNNDNCKSSQTTKQRLKKLHIVCHFAAATTFKLFVINVTKEECIISNIRVVLSWFRVYVVVNWGE